MVARSKDLPVEDVVRKLQQDSVHVELDENGHLYARGGKHLSGAQAHKEGWVEIQDLASQQIALAVDVKAGQKVWDCCAGAGGKSLAIAARIKNNKGVVIATDLHGYKLEELKRRSKRAEFHNIRSFEWAGDEPLRLPKKLPSREVLIGCWWMHLAALPELGVATQMHAGDSIQPILKSLWLCSVKF